MTVMGQDVLAVWPGRLAFCYCGRGWGSGSHHQTTPSSPASSLPCPFGLHMEVVIGHWLCLSIALPCPSVPSPTPGPVSCAGLCVFWLVQVTDFRSRLSQTQCWLGVLAGRGRCSRQEQADFLPCASQASLAPGSNPQVPLRPLLACVSRRMGQLMHRCLYLRAQAAPQPQNVSCGRHYFQISVSWGRDSQSRPCVEVVWVCAHVLRSERCQK